MHRGNETVANQLKQRANPIFGWQLCYLGCLFCLLSCMERMSISDVPSPEIPASLSVEPKTAVQDAAVPAEQADAEPVDAGLSVPTSEQPSNGTDWQLTIGAAGDALLHIGVKNTAAGQLVSPSAPGDDQYDGWWYVFKNLAPSLDKTDVAVVNLESPLAEERHAPSLGSAVLNGPAVAAQALKAVGFDLVNLANNHLYDQMRDGVRETIDAVNDAGLLFVGAGTDKPTAAAPLLVERNGATLAFFGWTYNMNRFPDNTVKDQPWVMKWQEDQALAAVDAVRSDVDLVIANIHWDADMSSEIVRHQKEVARQLCRGGVDLILGTGPHVLQPIRWLEGATADKKCLVVFSLGNLVSNQGLKYRYSDRGKDVKTNASPLTRDGLFFRVTFKKENEKISVTRMEGVPLWTLNNWLERYRKKPMPEHRIQVYPFLEDLSQNRNPRLQPTLIDRLDAIQRAVGDLVVYVPF